MEKRRAHPLTSFRRRGKAIEHGSRGVGIVKPARPSEETSWEQLRWAHLSKGLLPSATTSLPRATLSGPLSRSDVVRAITARGIPGHAEIVAERTEQWIRYIAAEEKKRKGGQIEKSGESRGENDERVPTFDRLGKERDTWIAVYWEERTLACPKKRYWVSSFKQKID